MRAKSKKMLIIGALALGGFILYRRQQARVLDVAGLGSFGSSFKKAVKKVTKRATAPVRLVSKVARAPVRLIGKSPLGRVLDKTPMGLLKQKLDKDPLKNFGKRLPFEKKAKKAKKRGPQGRPFQTVKYDQPAVGPMYNTSPAYNEPTVYQPITETYATEPEVYAADESELITPETEDDLNTVIPQTFELDTTADDSAVAHANDRALTRKPFLSTVIADLNKLFE